MDETGIEVTLGIGVVTIQITSQRITQVAPARIWRVGDYHIVAAQHQVQQAQPLDRLASEEGLVYAGLGLLASELVQALHNLC